MLESELLKAEGVAHGFFTRQGGVSEGIFASLNCGWGSQDNLEHVRENRARVAQKLGTEPARLLSIHQIHSAHTIVVEEPWGEPRPQADAMVTRTPGLALGILTADCAPVLLADAQARVVGAAHAGWKGAKGGVLEAVVQAMEELGAVRSRIRATVGPAISQASYEVGPEFEAAFIADDPSHQQYFRASPAGRPHFDLPAYCLARLKDERVGEASVLSTCTYENESLFFSFRRSTHRYETDYGRQISAILVL
jgi:YfiH family protein